MIFPRVWFKNQNPNRIYHIRHLGHHWPASIQTIFFQSCVSLSSHIGLNSQHCLCCRNTHNDGMSTLNDKHLSVPHLHLCCLRSVSVYCAYEPDDSSQAEHVLFLCLFPIFSLLTNRKVHHMAFEECHHVCHSSANRFSSHLSIGTVAYHHV